jgi:hypothetical protein
MQKKHFFYLLFLLLFVSCKSEQTNSLLNLNKLRPFLSKKKSTDSKVKNIKTIFFEASISHNKKNETDIWINSKNTEIYDSILDFYNLKFNSSFSDTIFNSWTTDSLDFVLFQKSDSVILISIFEREYE